MAELIAPLAAERPDAVALVDDRGSTTWAALDERTNRLVHALRARGLGVGDTVALMCGNQAEFFEVTAAAAHGGWTIVPVNWHWVADELAYVLGDSGAKALVVDARWVDVAVAALAQGPDVPVRIAVGAAPDGFEAYEDVLAGADPSEPADQASGGPMFYTSGTTGFPKGVRSGLTQTGLPPAILTLIAGSFRDMLGLPEGGVTLLCGPAYHSAQWVFAMFPLLSGGTVVLQHRFDPAEVLRLIDEHGVTNVHLVPTQFVRMLKLPDDVRAGFDGSSLQVVYHGAAPCPPAVKRAMIDWWGPCVHEYYGGTEGGFIAAISAEEWLEKPGSVGRVLPIVEVIVTDDEGNRLGPNEPGQLWFRSLLGSDFEYHNAPDKTAAAHLEPGVGTLGDIGYLDDDGFLFMSDRKIDMVISGGVNIYPAEIEGVLVAHPAVADAAVFGIPDDEMGEQVRAAVELVPGAVADDALIAALEAHCRAHLAGYKVPRSFEAVDTLPRNEAGKLQKRQLREPWWQDTGRAI